MRHELGGSPSNVDRVARAWHRDELCHFRDGARVLHQMAALDWLEVGVRAQLRTYRWGLALAERRRLWARLSKALPTLRSIRGDSDETRRITEFTAFAESLDPARVGALPVAPPSATHITRLILLATARHLQRALPLPQTSGHSVTLARVTTDAVRLLFPDICADVTVDQVRRRLRYWDRSGSARATKPTRHAAAVS